MDGKLVVDEENSRVLEKVGLVNGAVWSDLDGDGFPELILACEWGPMSGQNQGGHLHEITRGLDWTATPDCGKETLGIWTGTGDWTSSRATGV